MHNLGVENVGQENDMSEDQRFETVNLIVEIKRRISDGSVWSSHRPQTKGDQKRLDGWESGGLIQIAHALFIEMLRREAYTMAISIMSTGKPIVNKKELEQSVRAHLSQMLDKFIKGAVEETLDRIEKQKTPKQ